MEERKTFCPDEKRPLGGIRANIHWRDVTRFDVVYVYVDDDNNNVVVNPVEVEDTKVEWLESKNELECSAWDCSRYNATDLTLLIKSNLFCLLSNCSTLDGW